MLEDLQQNFVMLVVVLHLENQLQVESQEDPKMVPMAIELIDGFYIQTINFLQMKKLHVL